MSEDYNYIYKKVQTGLHFFVQARICPVVTDRFILGDFEKFLLLQTCKIKISVCRGNSNPFNSNIQIPKILERAACGLLI